MKKKKEILDELNEIAPGLRLPDKDGLDVPHNYFNNLTDELMKKVQPEQARVVEAPPSISWFDQLLTIIFQPKYGVAFAVIALLLVATYIYRSPTTQADPSLFAQSNETLSEDMIQEYIVSNIDDFDTDLLYEESLLAEQEVEESIYSDDDLNDLLDDLDASDLEDLL